MEPFNTSGDQHYSELVSRQVDQYRDTEIMHDLPPIFDYWSVKHNISKSAPVIGHSDIIDFYTDYFHRSLLETKCNFLISIGSGDSSIEIEIVKRLLNKEVKNFFFVCLELSPVLAGKARKKIDSESLGDVITVSQTDINKWKPNYFFAGVMAHHSLHHILNLEHLFSLIKNNLAPGGRFLTADIIGRNGHMRWPEALFLIRKIWEKLPHNYKFHHQLKKYDNYYDNWDCSTEGFEGIRAQDILPLLIEIFSFEVFYGYGNLIDPFIDRGFGPNFDPQKLSDSGFIDFIDELNEKLISDGFLKPTAMIAVMKNESTLSSKVYKHWTPQYCSRNPSAFATVYDQQKIQKYVETIAPFFNTSIIPDKKNNYILSKELVFKKMDSIPPELKSGIEYLGYGWCYPDSDCIWSSCEDASLNLALENEIKKDVHAELSFLIYQSPLYSHTQIDILVNNTLVECLKYDNTIKQGLCKTKIAIPASFTLNKTEVEIRFILPNRRQPQYESGEDLRALGIGLISLKLLEL